MPAAVAFSVMTMALRTLVTMVKTVSLPEISFYLALGVYHGGLNEASSIVSGV